MPRGGRLRSWCATVLPPAVRHLWPRQHAGVSGPCARPAGQVGGRRAQSRDAARSSVVEKARLTARWETPYAVSSGRVRDLSRRAVPSRASAAAHAAGAPVKSGRSCHPLAATRPAAIVSQLERSVVGHIENVCAAVDLARPDGGSCHEAHVGEVDARARSARADEAPPSTGSGQSGQQGRVPGAVHGVRSQHEGAAAGEDELLLGDLGPAVGRERASRRRVGLGEHPPRPVRGRGADRRLPTRRAPPAPWATCRARPGSRAP